MSAPNLQATLSTIPLLEGISKDSLQMLEFCASEREFPVGRALMIEDAWGNAVYLILSGWVKVRRAVGDTTKTLAVIGPGGFFGEMAILDEAPRSRDVVALTNVKAVVIPAEGFTALMMQEANVSYRIAQEISRRLRRLNQQMDRGHQSPPVRLVHVLVQLAETHAKSTPQGKLLFNVPVEDLADMADIPVETASKVLQKFAGQGVLKIDPERQLMLLAQYTKLVQATQLV